MKEKINKVKDIAQFISSITVIIGLIIGIYVYFNGYKTDQQELKNTLMTTQRMSLKSLIWNDNIPLVERTNACDEYLSMGFNSYTKKHCEGLLMKDLTYFDGKEVYENG